MRQLRDLLGALGKLFGLDDATTRAAVDEARCLEERAVEPEQRRWAFDQELLERPEHAAPGVLAVHVVYDQLRD